MNRERILNEFVTLTGFDSESYNEAEIREYLKEKLNKLGLLVSEDKAGNIYAILPGEKEQQAILFSSHMDTVSPGNGKKAIITPIEVHGYLYAAYNFWKCRKYRECLLEDFIKLGTYERDFCDPTFNKIINP